MFWIVDNPKHAMRQSLSCASAIFDHPSPNVLAQSKPKLRLPVFKFSHNMKLLKTAARKGFLGLVFPKSCVLGTKIKAGFYFTNFCDVFFPQHLFSPNNRWQNNSGDTFWQGAAAVFAKKKACAADGRCARICRKALKPR